jgi:hypothetical protein
MARWLREGAKTRQGYDKQNNLHWIEVLAINETDVIERRVTMANGKRIEDTHFAAATTPGTNERKCEDPLKYTTHKNKERMNNKKLHGEAV